MGACGLALMACASTPAPAAPLPLASASPRVETQSFMAELTSAAGTVTVTLEGRGEFHLNLEYPMTVELGASDTLTATDALERTDTRVRWSAPGVWRAARVRFATCTPDTCTPHEVKLALPPLP
jgi:hypothetical protein